MLEAEGLVLRVHQIEMGDHATLGEGPAPTHSDRAAAVGRDTTRLIPILARLEVPGCCAARPIPPTAATAS